jgi:hypothetical protein
VLRIVGVDQKNHVTVMSMVIMRLWDRPLVDITVVRDLAHLLLHGMPVTLLLHVVETRQIMIMDETHQAVTGVMIAAEAEDEEMTIANAALPAVDVAHLLRQDPMVLLVNG